MFQSLISQIESTLSGVAAIKAVYPYPVLNIEQYPAAIFFPDALQNEFHSTTENMKTYRFRLFVVVGAAQKSKEDIFSTVLPKAVDAVVAAFDSDWDGGTVAGHRVWLVVSSSTWTLVDAKDGLEAVAELIVEIRTATTNA